MSEPLVSVVIPVYNSQQFLRQAIDSVLEQRYDSIQIVVVDDGSTDESPSILRSYGDDLEIYAQKNAGSAVARNNAMRRARGEFIAFLDADDVWHPDKTRIQIGHLKCNAHVGVVFANLLFAKPTDDENVAEFLRGPVEEPVEIEPNESGWVYTKFLKESLLQTSSVIMRRSLVERIGEFDRQFRKGQDYDYWIRASREAQFEKLRPKLSVYRLHEEGITQKPSAHNYGALVIESALERWGRTGPDGTRISYIESRKRLGRLWFEYAYLHENKGDRQIARDGYLRSLRYEPWRIRSFLKYLATLFGLRRHD